MKKTVLFVVMAIATLCAAATDRLYIEDFSISAGETRIVSIMLDNETAYTAFQTDLYLPAGLTVEQEDGDYIFDLTSRKGRDHNISSQLQADGAIRIMSYSPSIKTYSGNSGALVTFNVTATADFSAPSTIQLKNTLFTTKSGEEISFNDEICNVTSDVELKNLTGEITFTQGGEAIRLCDYDGTKSTSYEYVDICYTGDEDVNFIILVNGYDIFDENIIGPQKSYSKDVAKEESSHELPEWIVWNCDINGYRIYLGFLSFIKNYFDECFGDFSFEVTINAIGYNDLKNCAYIEHMDTPICSGGSVSDVLTDFEIVLLVDSEETVKCLLIDDVLVNICDSGDVYDCFYRIDRQEEPFNITVQSADKTSGMYKFIVGAERTITVPAMNNRVDIIQCGPNGEVESSEVNHYALIRYCGDTGQYVPSVFSININGHQLTYETDFDDMNFENDFAHDYSNLSYYADSTTMIIDLLPYGESFGGKFDIQADINVGCLNGWWFNPDTHIVSAEAHFEYSVPIEAPTIVTQMTNDAVIVNMSSDLEYKKFIVDGEEVLELPYVAGRTNHDYYITVQAGHSPDSVRWAWTEEMTILIPAKEVPLLRGDVDGDGNVNISDVAALIDYLLSGNDALVSGKPDVDLNGAITIADVTSLIDYLLSDRWPGETSFTVNGVTFKLLDIAGGIFSMGATPEQEEGAHDNEKPVHEVALSPFSISVTEVTQELWLAVMGTNPSRFSSNLNRPVENVSWNDCQVFIAKLNELTGQSFRLPTEAEWEFAARGGMNSQGYKYAGSNDLDEVAWYNYNAHAVGSSSPDYGTHAVATKAPNELGLYDMTGNVWEWCQDWSGTYSEAQQINPTGPETGTTRVMRGGGWTNYPSLLRIAARAGYKPTFKGNFTGFRLAL